MSLQSKLNQLRSRARRAQSEAQRAARQLQSEARKAQSRLRRLQYDVEHPEIEINCSCGYHSKCRRSAHSLPDACPRCGAPILYM